MLACGCLCIDFFFLFYLFQTHGVNNNITKNHNNNVSSSQQILIKQNEIHKVPDHDPFTSPNLNISATLPTDNFANFDNNPIFNATPSDVFSGKIKTRF